MGKLKKFFKLYKDIFNTLSEQLKKNFYLLIIFNIFIGLIDVVGVLSAAPLVAVLTDSILISNNKVILYIRDVFNLSSKTSLILFFSFFTLFMFFLSFLGKVTQRYLNLRFSNKMYFYYSNNLFNYFLNRNYLFHLQKTSSELISNIYTDTQRLQGQILNPMLEICSNLFILMFVFITLLVVDFYLTTLFTLFFFIFYIFYSLIVQRKVSSYGKTISESYPLFFQSLFEGTRGIREVKLYDKIDLIHKNFENTNKLIANQSLKIDILTNLPRNIVELISYLLVIVSLNILLLHYGYTFSQITVLLSVYLLSLTKIIPALQKVYLNLISISSHSWTYYKIREYLFDFKNKKKQNFYEKNNNENIEFKSLISVNSLNFKYTDGLFTGLANIDFEIKKGDKISIIGKSGSGKSTLIDILSGLIPLDNGKIKIDNNILNEKNLKSWQKKISYVSQNTFLTNSSILENITFSKTNSEADRKKVRQILKNLNLNDFADNINDHLGEVGKKISGGQRQRISIARALFRNSEILIVDEGTSALDKENSDLILDYIFKIFKEKTIIFVCHSKILFERCDKFIYLDEGKLLSKGLVENLDNFDEFKCLN